MIHPRGGEIDANLHSHGQRGDRDLPGTDLRTPDRPRISTADSSQSPGPASSPSRQPRPERRKPAIRSFSFGEPDGARSSAVRAADGGHVRDGWRAALGKLRRCIAGTRQARCWLPVAYVRQRRQRHRPAAPRLTGRAAPRRDWGKTAMVIGGSGAAGAGIGALVGGSKGALIGAALAGGANVVQWRVNEDGTSGHAGRPTTPSERIFEDTEHRQRRNPPRTTLRGASLRATRASIGRPSTPSAAINRRPKPSAM